MPEEKERRRSSRHRPPTSYKENADDDPHDSDEPTELRAKVERQRARAIIQTVRYREKNREKILEAKKRYRKAHQEQQREYQRRYRETRRALIAKTQKRYRERHRARVAESKKRYRETHREQYREYRRRYWETHPEQYKAKERQKCNKDKYRTYKREYMANKRKRDKEKKRTAEKVEALGPLELTVTLTDYLKSPCVDTPVVNYLDTFCQSLEADDRPQPSFCQLLDDSYTLTDLDSGESQPRDPPVWDQWLDDLMEDIGDLMEDPLEDSLNLWDLLEGMSPDEWAQAIEDVLEPFDLDAFVT